MGDDLVVKQGQSSTKWYDGRLCEYTDSTEEGVIPKLTQQAGDDPTMQQKWALIAQSIQQLKKKNRCTFDDSLKQTLDTFVTKISPSILVRYNKDKDKQRFYISKSAFQRLVDDFKHVRKTSYSLRFTKESDEKLLNPDTLLIHRVPEPQLAINKQNRQFFYMLLVILSLQDKKYPENKETLSNRAVLWAIGKDHLVEGEDKFTRGQKKQLASYLKAPRRSVAEVPDKIRSMMHDLMSGETKSLLESILVGGGGGGGSGN